MAKYIVRAIYIAILAGVLAVGGLIGGAARDPDFDLDGPSIEDVQPHLGYYEWFRDR